jgi:hypothetical protein
MPPRYSYWTIIVDGGPTAFRAAERAELLPTMKQLQARNAGVELRWFARGRLWASPDEARQDLEQTRLRHRRARHPSGERRGPDWRPGGTHADPRARYQRKGRDRAGGRDRERQDRDDRGTRPSDIPIARPPVPAPLQPVPGQKPGSKRWATDRPRGQKPRRKDGPGGPKPRMHDRRAGEQPNRRPNDAKKQGRKG